jgi:hypothetical protein
MVDWFVQHTHVLITLAVGNVKHELITRFGNYVPKQGMGITCRLQVYPERRFEREEPNRESGTLTVVQFLYPRHVIRFFDMS